MSSFRPANGCQFNIEDDKTVETWIWNVTGQNKCKKLASNQIVHEKEINNRIKEKSDHKTYSVRIVHNKVCILPSHLFVRKSNR